MLQLFSFSQFECLQYELEQATTQDKSFLKMDLLQQEHHVPELQHVSESMQKKVSHRDISFFSALCLLNSTALPKCCILTS